MSHRVVPRRLAVVAMLGWLAAGAVLEAARLRPEAIDGWNRYVAAVERRRAREAQDGRRFLVMDFLPDAARDRRQVLGGGVVADAMEAYGAAGSSLDVPAALVHHWRGAVFLRGVSLQALVRALETEAPPTGPDVLASAVLGRGAGTMRLFLRLQRTRFVTVVYNTEHDVHFQIDGPGRASSRSVATRIREVADADTPEERELPAGDDRGFLWRLNAYWRYEAVPGGVIAECESVSLSRTIPFGLQYVAGPLIDSAARESVVRALEALRSRAAG
jgi:hypothetical protein